MPPWLEDLITGWVGMQFGDSPREALIRFVFEKLINPDQPEIVLQSYYDNLSIFVTLAVVIYFIEVIVRLMNMARNKGSASVEGRQLMISALFLFGFVASMPAVLASTQIVFNEAGKFFALSFIGSEDPDVFIETISKLSNNGGLDFVLSIVQIAVVFIFSISLVLIPLSLYASSFLLVMGVSMRWIGGFGESLFKTSMMVAAYALVGNAVALTITGIGASFARDMYKDDLTALALANTGVFVIAAWGTISVLVMLKQKISATVQGAVSGITTGMTAVRGGFHRKQGVGDRQVDEAITSRKRRGRNVGDEGPASATGKLKTRKGTQSPATLDSTSDPTTTSAPQTRQSRSHPRRYATTMSRSRAGITDKATKRPKPTTVTVRPVENNTPPPSSLKAQFAKKAATTAASAHPVGRAAIVAKEAISLKRKLPGGSK